MPAPACAQQDAATLIGRLRAIVGHAYVHVGSRDTKRYATGYRCGSGPVAAVVRPGTLIEQWRVLQACISANAIVIMQGANTGLTGGSTPNGVYDRPIVIINAMRIAGIHVLGGGEQVVCLPGATLHELERILEPLAREPHSVIGSSCIGASVFGGICNNSGGALIRRGPAYTELALFAQLDGQGGLHLVNHLGIDLGDGVEGILRRVEAGDFAEADVSTASGRAASDHRYCDHVRQVDEPTPARFNADPSRLFEASGCAGKVMLLAVRLDTFPAERHTTTFYIGTNDASELNDLRRHMLAHFAELPISGEYLHRDAFDIAETYGKDMFLAIRHLGANRIPTLMALKNRVDRIAGRLPGQFHHASDHILQTLARLFPAHLPARMKQFRARFAHHLLLKMSASGAEETRRHLSAMFPSAGGDFFQCTPDEAEKAFLHRFVIAGAAVRYRAVHARDVEDIVALDIALPRNATDWFETLPAELSRSIVKSLYYGHFFCHVFHQDYIVAKGHCPTALEEKMWALLDARGAEYPAEHNVGHLYHAKPELVAHYRALDPCNVFNPGVGRTSKQAHWL
ncbi:D-lactate dehydrogenase [Hyphomicrobium sp.]|uniref:D-lactate dehydrogenase n=1 Tax=Hyphomicrobium sp. TaxID=82 RepID=UPI0025BC9442|nr:D-lactate dehydrogenase [Hyphomicrobium sp.]MCC7253032.1 D-lactate dehydrogenase [Hyphomicrobium sp.]